MKIYSKTAFSRESPSSVDFRFSKTMDGKKFGTIFVTGGAGYIGSHCVVDLLEAGYQVITCDNFSNSVVNSCDAKSLPPSLQRVEELTGKKVTFYPCDLVNYQQLDDIFNQVKTTLFFKKLWVISESEWTLILVEIVNKN